MSSDRLTDHSVDTPLNSKFMDAIANKRGGYKGNKDKSSKLNKINAY